MSNKNKPHPHAELIKAWADGAKIQYRVNDETDCWEDCNPNPGWCEFHEYRVKPEEPSNEPWKPKEGEEDKYPVISFDGFEVYSKQRNERNNDKIGIEMGNCFRTREEAAAAERVVAALKGDFATDNNVGRKEPELDGTPLTNIEKEAIRKFRASVPFPEAESGTGRALSPGEDALIRALRAVIIMEVYPWDNSALVYKYGNGELKHTSQVIAFSLYAPSSSTKKAMDEINTALACIAEERHKGGIQ